MMNFKYFIIYADHAYTNSSTHMRRAICKAQSPKPHALRFNAESCVSFYLLSYVPYSLDPLPSYSFSALTP